MLASSLRYCIVSSSVVRGSYPHRKSSCNLSLLILILPSGWFFIHITALHYTLSILSCLDYLSPRLSTMPYCFPTPHHSRWCSCGRTCRLGLPLPALMSPALSLCNIHRAHNDWIKACLADSLQASQGQGPCFLVFSYIPCPKHGVWCCCLSYLLTVVEWLLCNIPLKMLPSVLYAVLQRSTGFYTSVTAARDHNILLINKSYIPFTWKLLARKTHQHLFYWVIVDLQNYVSFRCTT